MISIFLIIFFVILGLAFFVIIPLLFFFLYDKGEEEEPIIPEEPEKPVPEKPVEEGYEYKRSLPGNISSSNGSLIFSHAQPEKRLIIPPEDPRFAIVEINILPWTIVSIVPIKGKYTIKFQSNLPATYITSECLGNKEGKIEKNVQFQSTVSVDFDTCPSDYSFYFLNYIPADDQSFSVGPFTLEISIELILVSS